MSTRIWVAAGSLACVAASWLATGSTVSTSFTSSAPGSITVSAAVWLENADQCKNGGWQTSTRPVFKNQGDCVSWFAVPSRGPAGESGSTAAGDPQQADAQKPDPQKADVPQTIPQQTAADPTIQPTSQQPAASDQSAQQPAQTAPAADPAAATEPSDG